jgi:1-acyl-sn-glycerol-3-phosphate acyltransferase
MNGFLMNQLSKTKEYHTPTDKKPCLLKQLHFPLRISFYHQILRIIYSGMRTAQQGKYDSAYWIKQSMDVLAAVESNGGKVHLSGLDHVRNTAGPVVFIGNHMSTLETFLLPCLIEPLKEHTFIVKESLVTHPFFGPIMRSRNPIVVSRKNAKEDLKLVLQEGTKKLQSGQSLIIFPQSTRSLSLNRDIFNSLGVKVAKKADVPVIPIALKTDFWGNGKLFRDFGPVGASLDIFLEFGEPMKTKGPGKEEHERIFNFISSRLEQWSKPFPKNLI